MDLRRPSRHLLAALTALLASSAPAQSPTDPAVEQKSHDRMVRTLAEIAERMKSAHKYHGDGTAKQLWAQLAEQGDKATWKLRLDAALAHLRLGNTREGVRLLTEARDGLRTGSIQGDTDAKNGVSFYLGMAWLRQAETDNCCARSAPESCILPLHGGALHTQKEGSTNAIPCFEEVMANSAPDDYWHLSARWLLNIAHMTLGTYPDGVPEDRRIPIEALKSEIPFPHFPNVAAKLGLDIFDMLGGAVIDDFDGDGDLDVMLSLWSANGQLRYFRNDGDGTFTERTKEAGLLGITSGINLFQADYDNDGDLDVILLRGAWLHENGRHPNSLLKNKGDGTFVDATFAAGLGEVAYPSSQADWADIDNDGDLDLYIGNETTPELRAPCQLFRNDGDGTFYDIGERAGVANIGYTKGVSFGDYDNDGLPDLYVSNLAEENHLYHNLGNRHFEDVAPKLGMTKPVSSFGTWFWDFDNDGNLDLFCAAYSTGVGHIAGYHLGIEVKNVGPHDLLRLWHGDGKGGFTDIAAQMGLTYPALPMGANFGDLDNDGWLDFYLGTGDPYYYNLMPNLMYKNMGGKRFVDVSMAGGFAHLQKGHSISFADLDSDGDLDVYAVMGGAYPGDPAHNALYQNPGFGNHWLCVRLVGTESNRCGIGARIRAIFDEEGSERSVYRTVNSGGSFGANPLRQTLGLGKAAKVKTLEIFWPRTGKTQTLKDLAVDRMICIVEGKDGCTTVQLTRTVLGGK
ncbi:MAG: CRTAC1 family protein [Planctomycetota bacterium]